MSLKQETIVFHRTDKNGNKVLQMPITIAENVEGIEFLPVGTILPYGGNDVPTGYLDCNGSEVSRVLYADLFTAIGTKYGAGDGSTTFNLPNSGTNIVSDVATGDLAVVGNGQTIGLTNGSELCGMQVYGYTPSGSYLVNPLQMASASYGKAVGSNSSSSTQTSKTVGLTTDGGNSGIVAKMTATKTTVKYIIKAFSYITDRGELDVEHLVGEVNRLQTEISKNPFDGKATSIGTASDTKPAVVVKSYRSGNSWYRKYSDGWIEQGGLSGSSSNQSVTFPIAFSSTVCTLVASKNRGSSDHYPLNVGGVTNTGFVAAQSSDTAPCFWYACGY